MHLTGVLVVLGAFAFVALAAAVTLRVLASWERTALRRALPPPAPARRSGNRGRGARPTNGGAN